MKQNLINKILRPPLACGANARLCLHRAPLASSLERPVDPPGGAARVVASARDAIQRRGNCRTRLRALTTSAISTPASSTSRLSLRPHLKAGRFIASRRTHMAANRSPSQDRILRRYSAAFV